jgi:hypothetical protein
MNFIHATTKIKILLQSLWKRPTSILLGYHRSLMAAILSLLTLAVRISCGYDCSRRCQKYRVVCVTRCDIRLTGRCAWHGVTLSVLQGGVRDTVWHPSYRAVCVTRCDVIRLTGWCACHGVTSVLQGGVRDMVWRYPSLRTCWQQHCCCAIRFGWKLSLGRN